MMALLDFIRKAAKLRWRQFRYKIISIKRDDRDDTVLRRLHWKPCHPTTIARFKASMICSEGHLLTLRSHAVTEDGFVIPSVVCPSPGCSFHAVVRLRNWTFGEVH